MFDFKRAVRRNGALCALAMAATTQVFAQNPATTVNVDVNANRKAINPNIYGTAFATTAQLGDLNAPLNRSGGNNTSSYNWQLNADNRANDWFFESLAYPSATQGEVGDTFISTTKAGGAQPLITIPMVPYIANLGPSRGPLWSFSIAKYGAQTNADFSSHLDAGNGVSSASGNPNITGNNPLDASIANSAAFEQGWMNHIVTTFGPASSNGLKYYIMDNEPGIWHSTHRDIHPIGASMDEYYNDFVAYASAVKTADPSALVVGPEEWGWFGYLYSGLDQQTYPTTNDKNSHGGMDYLPWLLQQLKAYETAHGKRLLDVFTVHYYPQGGEYSNDDSANEQLVRNKSTRSLWDLNYVDQTWINAAIYAIPRIKGWVSTYYPGLPCGITEYNWGDEANLNGATAQADVYGIFGREGLDMSTRWTTPATNSPAYLSMKIYRNYDGAKSTFGDTSCYAGVVNPDQLSAFAAQRTSDSAATVMVINKITGTTPVTINLANFASTGIAHVYQISSAAQTSITQLADVSVSNNMITATEPSQSITLYVIPHGAILPAPTAPTGLTAVPNNTTVALSWLGGGGATSYNIKRSTVSGSGYVTVGTVNSPAPNSFTNTGLTNGTTYYYVVSGTNSAGTSPNSAEVSAVLLVWPTFTSSATVNPTPEVQGANTTITGTFTDTSGTMTNGVTDIEVYNSAGAKVGQQQWTAQNFTLNQQQQYSMTFNSNSPGAYTVKCAVFNAAFTANYHWNDSAATFSVIPTTAFTSSATANPASVAGGAVTAITGSFTETGPTGLTNGIIDIEVYNSGGTKVGQNTWSGVNFNVNQNEQFTFNWTSATAPGTYTIKCAVFNSDWSIDYHWNDTAGTVTVTGGGGAPPAPTGLTATAGNAQVALAWTASSGATSYNVKRSTVNGSGYATAASPATTAYTNTGLTNGTTYYFVVTAVNTSGESGNSNQASATPVAPPAAPTGLTATPGNAQVALSWTASSGATAYDVKRSTVSGSGYVTVSSPTVTNYTNTGLTNGTVYYFVVDAKNAGGTSANSAQASATPVAPPAAPTGLTATPGNAQVALSWTASGGATAYDVKRSTVSGAGYATVSSPTVTNYTNTGLTNGTTYYFVVDAKNAGGTSANSAQVSTTPSAGSAPPVPTGLAGIPTDAQIALTWNASTGATAYDVKRSTVSGSGYVTVSSPTMSSYTNTGLTDGTTYYYVVAAKNASGSSANSAQISGIPAQYNFESGTQGFTFNLAPITGVAQSTAQAFGVTHSLAVTINGAAGTSDALVASPTTPAGKVVTYRVWIPTGSQLTYVQPYVLQGAAGGWLWTGNIVPIASLTAGAWNTIQVTVPANAAMPLYQLGVEFKTGATWSGTCYVDSISW